MGLGELAAAGSAIHLDICRQCSGWGHGPGAIHFFQHFPCYSNRKDCESGHTTSLVMACSLERHFFQGEISWESWLRSPLL